MTKRCFAALALASTTLLLTACDSSKWGGEPVPAPDTVQSPPRFTMVWSEHPSWSVFGVAEEQGLIHGEAGSMGTMETRWDVDIVLNRRGYDTCIAEFQSSSADAVCITNVDILGPSGSRPAVCVLPTSTSTGADACLTIGIDDLDALAGVPTYGSQKSVSQYCFERILEIHGKDPSEFPFQNMRPDAAARALQQGQDGIRSIMVSDPLLVQTRQKQSEAKVLFDSSSIQGEIIGMVVIAKDALARDGGERFANALLDSFFAVNKLIDNAETRDQTLAALGANLSQLGAEEIKTVIAQTQLYNTPGKALDMLNQKKFLQETMPAVAQFVLDHDMANTQPTFGMDQADAQLNFDTQFLIGMAASSDYSSEQRP